MQVERVRQGTIELVVETMTSTVCVARALVMAGCRIDLEGLDQEIGDLCAEAVALPRAEGQSIRPALEALLREVDQLYQELRAQEPLADPFAAPLPS